MEDTRRVIRRVLPSVAKLALAIVALATLLAAIIYWRARHRTGAPLLPAVLLWQLAVWAPWLALAPAIDWLSRRFPRGAMHPAGWLVVHSVAALLTALSHLLWYYRISDAFSPYAGLAGTKFGVYPYFFIFWFVLDLVLYWAWLAFAHERALMERSSLQIGRIAQLERALSETGPNGERLRTFAVRKNGKSSLIPAEDVRWIEAQGYYAALHTGNGTYLLRESLTGLSRRLDAAQFVRVHRSTIANVHFIRSVEGDRGTAWTIVLADGARRRVSRAGKRRLKRRVPGLA